MSPLLDHLHFVLAVNQDLFITASQWILKQAQYIILAALVVLGLRAWMNGQMMGLFGGIVVAAILYLLTTGSADQGGILDQLSAAVQGIFGITAK